MVTGWPEVRLTPYIGAVVLYVDLEKKKGVICQSQYTAGLMGMVGNSKL